MASRRESSRRAPQNRSRSENYPLPSSTLPYPPPQSADK